MKKLSPHTLRFLLHCYSSPDSDDIDLGLYADEIKDWVGRGIIIRDSAFGSTPVSGYIYRTTKLGDAWATLILNTPVPTPAFIDHQGNVIK